MSVNVKLIEQNNVVTQKVYEVVLDGDDAIRMDGSRFLVKELQDQNGRVIDTTVLDEQFHAVEDPMMFEQIDLMMCDYLKNA